MAEVNEKSENEVRTEMGGRQKTRGKNWTSLAQARDEWNKLKKILIAEATPTDIYEEVQEKELKPKKLLSECVGGGRINHNPGDKNIKVYGYSQGFGKADHSVSVDLLRKRYPEYEITWSDEGY